MEAIEKICKRSSCIIKKVEQNLMWVEHHVNKDKNKAETNMFLQSPPFHNSHIDFLIEERIKV